MEGKEGYKKTKLGWIPEEWDIVKFKNVYEEPIRDFGSFSSTKIISFLDNGVPFLKSEMIGAGEIYWDRVFYISEKVHKKLNKSYIKGGQILFSKIGSALGKAVVYEGEYGECNSNAAIAKITVDNAKANRYFITYLLNNNLSKRQFKQKIISLLPRINLGDISSLLIPLPPLNEQLKIVEILSTYDKSIKKLGNLVSKKEDVKKGLMQTLLTGKKRFKKFVQEDGFHGTKLGELPKDWDVLRLSDIVDIRSSNVDKKSKEGEIQVELCNYMDVYNNEYIDKSIKFMPATATTREIERFRLDVGDVVITKDSETPEDIAMPAVVSEDLEGVVCGYHLVILRPKKKKINGFFLSIALQEPSYHHHFIRLANGVTRFGLTVGSIEKAIVPVPPLEEQEKIVKVFANLNSQISDLKEELDILKTQKKGMMQKLLTGEVRVNVKKEG